jgi:hypothetical protein
VWWCTPVIPAFRRLKQEDLEFRVSRVSQGDLFQKNNIGRMYIVSKQMPHHFIKDLRIYGFWFPRGPGSNPL